MTETQINAMTHIIFHTLALTFNRTEFTAESRQEFVETIIGEMNSIGLDYPSNTPEILKQELGIQPTASVRSGIILAIVEAIPNDTWQGVICDSTTGKQLVAEYGSTPRKAHNNAIIKAIANQITIVEDRNDVQALDNTEPARLFLHESLPSGNPYPEDYPGPFMA